MEKVLNNRNLLYGVTLILIYLSCNILDFGSEKSIEGTYILTDGCMTHMNKKGVDEDIYQNDDEYDTIEHGCVDWSIDNSILTTSTLIITKDSIIRFGFHCPGDNSGTTRIAYGYKIQGNNLIGDSLVGTIVFDGDTLKRVTEFEKMSNEVLTITQSMFTYLRSIDSTFYSIYDGRYEKRDSAAFKYDDQPTCSNNYDPWFPIPFW